MAVVNSLIKFDCCIVYIRSEDMQLLRVGKIGKISNSKHTVVFRIVDERVVEEDDRLISERQ